MDVDDDGHNGSVDEPGIGQFESHRDVVVCESLIVFVEGEESDHLQDEKVNHTDHQGYAYTDQVRPNTGGSVVLLHQTQEVDNQERKAEKEQGATVSQQGALEPLPLGLAQVFPVDISGFRCSDVVDLLLGFRVLPQTTTAATLETGFAEIDLVVFNYDLGISWLLEYNECTAQELLEFLVSVDVLLIAVDLLTQLLDLSFYLLHCESPPVARPI